MSPDFVFPMHCVANHSIADVSIYTFVYPVVLYRIPNFFPGLFPDLFPQYFLMSNINQQNNIVSSFYQIFIFMSNIDQQKLCSPFFPQ